MSFHKEELNTFSDVDSQEERALAEKFFQVGVRDGLAAYAHRLVGGAMRARAHAGAQRRAR